MTQKVQVLDIFALGYLSAAASAVRVYILLYDSYGTNLSYRDVQGENTKIVIWSLVGIVASLIGATLPTLRPLFANTSLGSFLGSIFSVISLHSWRGSTREEKEDEKLAQVTIGGSEWKGPQISDGGSSKADSMSLKDVGRLV
ncbi:hypothetical protein EK21DRAFT_107752 [Setomelanomma holmii]|uniref:Rhodopsin domain-containing protein n=1 Tax=Setomelanomma holmii TaxID=210430 RepID=A0A9P4LSC2_9PLEO|nr:hypothetical protein EK21DRAFT_107752 [Setomelanomma holmii]